MCVSCLLRSCNRSLEVDDTEEVSTSPSSTGPASRNNSFRERFRNQSVPLSVSLSPFFPSFASSYLCLPISPHASLPASPSPILLCDSLGSKHQHQPSKKTLRLVSGNLRSGWNHFCPGVVNPASCAISDSAGNVELTFTAYGEGTKVQDAIYQLLASRFLVKHGLQ